MTAPAKSRVYPYMNGGRPGRQALPPLSQPELGPGGCCVKTASAGSNRPFDWIQALLGLLLCAGVARPQPVPVVVDDIDRQAPPLGGRQPSS